MKVLFKKTKEIKEVNDSYAVNYLIPQGIAVAASSKVIKEEKDKNEARKKDYKEKQKRFEELAKKTEGKKAEINKKTNDKGDLFGSVGKQEIKKAFGIKDKISVILKEPIKRVGEYNLELKIGKNKVKVTLIVKAS